MDKQVDAVSREHGEIEFRQIQTPAQNTITTQATGAFGSIIVSEITAINQRIWYSQFFIKEDMHLTLTLREELPSLRLIFCLKDNMIFYVNGGEKSVRRTQQYDLLYNFESTIEYEFKKEGEYAAIVIFMKFGWLSQWKNSVPDLAKLVQQIEDQKFLLITKATTAHMRDILQELINNRNQRSIFVESKVLELLSMVVDQLTSEPNKKSNYLLSEADLEKVQKARDYLQEDIARRITIVELAKFIGIHEVKLKYGFRQLFDVTIHDFVLQERMRLAAKLLISSKLSMKEIAKVVGYKSYPHFCSAFKKSAGYSASSVRKSRSS